VSLDGEYSGEIFDSDLCVVQGDLYTRALSRPRVSCRHYSVYKFWSCKSGNKNVIW